MEVEILKIKSRVLYLMLILTLLALFFNIGNVSATNSTNFTVDQIGNASFSVQSYVEANHKLPNNVTIAGTTMTMPQFLNLETTAVHNIYNNITTNITLGSYNNATNPSESITTTGNLTNTSYVTLANNVMSYMSTNGRAPNYQSTSLGNMRYENLVYTFAEIMNSYMVAKDLPNFIIVRPWTTITNSSTKFINMNEINYAAETVKCYVETNHQIPNNVTVSGNQVTMPQFLKLETMFLTYVNGNLFQSIPLGSYGTAPSPSESITGGNLQAQDYYTTACNIIAFMDSNGRAPNAASTILGTIRYENLVYTYAEIINSISRNKGLPSYICLVPWTTVSNTNKVFITMDQINTAASSVKLSVETNHTLPSNVTIGNRQVNMQDFLKLEIMSIKNIYAGLYQSIILINYSPATNPTETVTGEKENYESYMNIVENIRLYMQSNGRAPNYQTGNVGNIRFESLIYMYAQLLNYNNVNKALPSNIIVNSWSSVTNPNTKTFDTGQIISGAESIISFVETNHNLPTNVTIAGTNISMSNFLKMALATIQNIDGKLYGQVVLGNFSEPGTYSETITGGSLNKTDYLNLAKDIENFIIANGRGPAYQTTSFGNIHYKSLVYIFSQILSSYKTNNYILPDLITVRPWSVVSNANTKFFTIDQIETAATTVKTYVETNHTLPGSVIINNTSVTMPKFLKLITTVVANINGKLTTSIVLQDYSAATSPSESITGGSVSSTDYLILANSIISFMDTNGRAPNYQTVTMGNIRYESLVFMYSQMLSYESNEDKLPASITVDKWSVVSNTSNTFFTLDQIKTAAANVQSYVETNHDLPTNISIGTTTVTRAQFLQLLTTAIQNANDSLLTSFFKATYSEPPTPSESITDPTFNKKDYLGVVKDVMAFMYTNGRGPNYKTTTHGNIQYQNLIYMFSKILNSNNATGTMPQSITIQSWATISNANSKLFTIDQIKTAAETVKNYVDTNHQLPANITINGQLVTMPQFLKLTAQSVLNIENYLNTSVILETVTAPSSPSENITSGIIYRDEFVDMAKEVLSYMNSHSGATPNNISDTSLGDTIRYESLIYLFSNVIISYNASEHAPDHVSVIPWLAISNPNGTFNFRTQKVFNSIQAAIDDTDTLSGDTLWLGKTNYIENITVNKKINIRPVNGIDVMVEASNPNLPVFTINVSGNGTSIRDLIINGSTGNAGIYINNSSDNYILGNTITNNNNGIYIYNSSDNLISGNELSNNTLNGLLINLGLKNMVSGNEIYGHGTAGVNVQDSNENGIYSNNIYNNLDGIHLNNSSTKVNYNRIAENSRYGLKNEGNSIVDATNNWWGSNNPTVSLTSPSDICIAGGTVTYNPNLVLIINSSTDRSDRSGDYYNYLITADLTHNNQGNDTSPDGNIPDDIPINFSTTLGMVNSSALTKKGKTELTLSCTSAGTANVSATLDNQTITRPVTITSINTLGVYNTRTQESFATIQDAIIDPDTQNGDTITLAEGIYTENVIVNKKLIIQPVTGANVTVKADETKESVIVLNNGGSGSTIQGLNIVGSSDSNGISLSHAFNIIISNNIISGANKGIYLYQSGNNIISGNTINNNYYGINSYESTNNNITGNNVNNNQNGIYLASSNSNTINGNTVKDNWYGLYLMVSSSNAISGNDISDSWVGLYIFQSNNNSINNDSITDNGVGITYFDSIGITITGNTFSNNWISDTSVVDSSQMFIATTNFSCGAAALATVLKNLGIITNELEIGNLAGTDETGTSLLGLKTAAISKGATAIGVRIDADQLQANYIAVLSINGFNHFVVIQNIDSNMVTLIDPNLGTIQISRDKFDSLYSGVALIINGSAPPGAIVLNDNEMQDVKANGHWESYYLYSYWIPIPYIDHYEYIDFGGIWYPYCNFNWNTWHWESGWAYLDFGGIWIPICGIYYMEIPIYGVIYVPDIEYQYNEDRILPCTEVGLSILALAAGCVSGYTEGLGLASGISLVAGSGATAASVYMGEITRVYTDPWLRVTVDGHQVYPYLWW